MILLFFLVVPGAPGLLRDKAAAGLPWLFPPCSSHPPVRSSALWRGAKTAFLTGYPWWHHERPSLLCSTQGLDSRCSSDTTHRAGLCQGTGCQHTASSLPQPHLPSQRGSLFPEELAELVPTKISSHAFLMQLNSLRLLE